MFSNASDRDLENTNNGLPNMGGVLDGWLISMIFSVVTKTIVNFKTVEVTEEISFQGVWQPVNTSMEYKQESQRTWKYYIVYAKVDLKLSVDDIITYRGKSYRVHTDTDFGEYGYYTYNLTEDYKGKGPY